MKKISWQSGLLMLLLLLSGRAQAQPGVTAHSGILGDGATFLLEVPANWNGTLLLYSHGYVVPGDPNPALDAGDPITGAFLLSNGFALAGSSYATTGWAIHEALPDQMSVLDLFDVLVGHPTRTVAWGHSLGGIITAGLIQRFPDRFDAALPMCGLLSGGVAIWNQGLDTAFAFANLLGLRSGLRVVDIVDPDSNLALAEQVLAEAQASPEGRARLALAAAFSDTPGWFTPTSPEPTAREFGAQEANQFLWFQEVSFPFAFALRAELEFRAGGNPSSNAGVDYRRQFDRSVNRDEVRALYQEAGLSLDADLDTLNDTARITADPQSLRYLEHNIIFDGRIHIPVLTMHTEGDGLVSVENESAYKQVVREAGNIEFLRESFVHRAGHCAFTPAETVTALQSLIQRLDTGGWPDLEPVGLNDEASALGPTLNVFPVADTLVPVPPAFFHFKPAPFLRPFDALTPHCETGRGEEYDCESDSATSGDPIATNKIALTVRDGHMPMGRTERAQTEKRRNHDWVSTP